MDNAMCITTTTVFLLILDGALSNKAFLTFSEEPKDTTFNEGSNRDAAIFNCRADGYPKPDITWLANEQIITENNLYNVSEEGRLRILTPPRRLNGSSYRCIANNSFGAAISTAAILEIAYVANFEDIESPEISIQVKQGKCLECSPPNAYPGIKASWMKDTQVTPDDRRRVMIDGRLCFAHTQMADSGSYSCFVSNRYDDGGATGLQRRLEVTLTVTSGGSVPGQSLTEVPDIQESVTVRQGQEAVLECFFLGRPTPTLEWRRQDSALPLNSTLFRKNRQELRIRNAQPEDSGVYECTGTSKGYSRTVSRHLTVLAPPSLTTVLQDEEVDSGSTVTLQCAANDDAEVEFSWYHNARQINNSMHRRMTENNTLVIDHFMVRDSGIYQCAARNEHGVSISTAQIWAKQEEPKEEEPTESEKNPTERESQGGGAGETLVNILSLVVMQAAVLLEVI